MKIIDIQIDNILSDKELNNKFLSIRHKQLNIECSILNDNFYLDSFNYFPVTENFNSFLNLFEWGDKHKYKNFFSAEFFENLKKNKNNFNKLSDVFILGSSPYNNYYSNLIFFLPRIFFINKQKIKLAIHRNTSNKFRNFIFKICRRLKIEAQIIFLDDDFSFYHNSQIPQFLNKRNSINILNHIASIENISNDSKQKIFLSRQNTSYRNLINEGDISEKLKKNGFKIIDLNDLEIWDQIKLFASSKTIVSPSGSSLANIVFCQPGTKIIEISPVYQFAYEKNLQLRYKNICNVLKLDHYSFNADPVKLDYIDENIKKVISPKVLNESNYYKNLVLRLDKIDEIIKI